MQDVGKEVTNNEVFGDWGCWCYLQDKPMASSSNSHNRRNSLSLSIISALLYSPKALHLPHKITSIYSGKLGF